MREAKVKDKNKYDTSFVPHASLKKKECTGDLYFFSEKRNGGFWTILIKDIIMPLPLKNIPHQSLDLLKESKKRKNRR